MDTPNKSRSDRTSHRDADDVVQWQPPLGERIMVSFIGGVLAGILGFRIVYSVLQWGMSIRALAKQRYSTKDPLVLGVWSGAITLLSVGTITYLVSSFGRRSAKPRRMMRTIAGLVLAAIVGATIACQAVYEERPFDVYLFGQVLLRPNAHFVAMNEAKSNLAGLLNGMNCGAFAGIRLYAILDQKSNEARHRRQTSGKQAKQ